MSIRVQRVLAVLLVVLGGALAYGPALDSDFLNLDDQEFIVENPWIPGGLTLDSVKWALTADVFEDSEYVDYWQPATLISRLIDGALFGLNPAGHHLTSLLIHLVNAVLLLLLLAAATGRLWRSAVVALVFATHPLHVSSVAWVTERKDVLSAFFSLISLAIFARFAAAYREHLERRSDGPTGGRVIRWYLLLAAGYALCLMSKPMTLPLPLLMLLVAVWPIPRDRRPGLDRLALCLAPLLLLSASAIFLYTRVRIVSSELDRIGFQSLFSLAERLVMSLAVYPLRLLYPLRLQHIYAGHPDEVTLWKAAGSLLLLGAVTFVAKAGARRRPYLGVGWLWYIISIFPAATAFQTSAAADRFSYFPVIGLTVMIVWSIGEYAGRRWLAIRAAAATAAVIALALATRAECRYWKDSTTLFSHLLELDPNHDLAYCNLCSALFEAGEPAKALNSCQAALALRPDLPSHHYNVGTVLQRLDRLDEALRSYAEAIRLDPLNGLSHHGLGMILWSQGKIAEAEAEFREAIRLSPCSAPAHNSLGMVLWGEGRVDEAEAKFREAIRLNPGFASAHFNLGLVLGKAEKYDEALTHFRKAVTLNPKDDEARDRVEVILERQRREPEPSVVR
ncbi:MAG: tetratricopeptide repeat protein [Candidatus Methylomirabilia bacterium]